MTIELTKPEVATLKSCLEGALIDAKGLEAIFSGGDKTKLSNRIANIEALLGKISKN